MANSTPAPSSISGVAQAALQDERRSRTEREPARPAGSYLLGRVALGISLIALLAIAASYVQPFWTFKLYAPQYPRGLTLTISLTGFAGDVREIDMLNHYIGMGSLAQGAVLERRFGGYALLGLGLCLLLLALHGRSRSALVAAGLGLCYPAGFLLDTFYWLYTFGHSLDPRAPLRVPAFTPQLFGNGSIGQFMTFAVPERGFWLSIAAAGLLVTAAALRLREERSCAAR